MPSWGPTGATQTSSSPTWIVANQGLPPSTKLYNSTEWNGFHFVIPVGDISGDAWEDYILPMYSASWVLTPPVPRGTFDAAELGFRRISFSAFPPATSAAGDLTGDGQNDLWLAPNFFEGPISHALAEAITDDIYANRVLAYGWVETVWNTAVIGNIDADGDGFTDAYFHDSTGAAELAYGPFQPGANTAPSRSDTPSLEVTTVTRNFDTARYEGLNLGQVNEPGSLVLTSGWGVDSGCGPGIFLFDFANTRGMTLDAGDDAFFLWYNMNPIPFQFDDDGLTDFSSGLGLFDHPLVGTDATMTSTPFATFEPEAGFEVNVGDVSGDGLDDLMAIADVEDDEGVTTEHTYIVPGACLFEGGRLDEVGVEISREGQFSWGWSYATHGDFDADGISDPAMGSVLDDDLRKWLYIWSGAEIRALLQARTTTTCGLP